MQLSKIKTWPRWLLGLVILGIIALLWLIPSLFLIYTEDAYVMVDSVSVASQVQGRVVAIHVRNNDVVEAGAPLIDIDPTPYQLKVSVAEGNLASAQSALPVVLAQIEQVKATLAGDQANLDYLTRTQARDQQLLTSGAVTQQNVDDINSQVLVANAKVKETQAQQVRLEKLYQQDEVKVTLTQHQLALAQYNLAQTHIVANQSGTITSFKTYVGAYLNVGDPLFTLVTNAHWRVIANIKEYDLKKLHPGQTVWVSLSSTSLHLYAAKVQSISRGVAREVQPSGSLEYVDPTVDWIRYDYRFPVTIIFDNPPPDLYMGEDARVWIFEE